MKSIVYADNTAFELVDPALIPLATGGIQAAISLFGDPEINNGCVKDNENVQCVSPNVGQCGVNTVCVEVI
jgi:hypothetical protein